jgi:hypothetical protein
MSDEEWKMLEDYAEILAVSSYCILEFDLMLTFENRYLMLFKLFWVLKKPPPSVMLFLPIHSSLKNGMNSYDANLTLVISLGQV